MVLMDIKETMSRSIKVVVVGVGEAWVHFGVEFDDDELGGVVREAKEMEGKGQKTSPEGQR